MTGQTGAPDWPAATGETAHIAFRAGTHRAVAPAVTLERMAPVMRAMGITRLADITGLDTPGLPVAVACRPNSGSNAVFQGKGLSRDAAMASALMEAVETFHAETILQPVWYARAAELAPHHRLADCGRLPAAADSRFSSETDILWIEGWDLLGRCPALVPYETVHARYTLPLPPGSGCFAASTTGLASGNTRWEALSHALCKVIERDSRALFEQRPDEHAGRRIDLRTARDPDCAGVIARLDAAGLAVAAWDMTSDIGVPAFAVQVMERADGPGLLPLPAEGHGCHPDRSLALLRALSEAAQTRLTVISGARDDIGEARYGPQADHGTLGDWLARLESPGTRSLDATPTCDLDSFTAEAGLLLARLRSCGIDQAIVVDLTRDAIPGCAVVRVVVPGLEGLWHPDVAPGAGAAARRSTCP